VSRINTMKIDRRKFMAAVSSAAAAANGLASSSCVDATPTSAANAIAAANPSIDPRALGDRINGDGEFQLRARYWDASVRLRIGDASYDALVQGGKIAGLALSNTTAKADVTITGPAQAWAHGFLARGLTIEGDQVSHVAPYRGAILRIIAHVREALGQSVPDTSAQETTRQFDAAVGRYMYVRIGGVQYRVYFEETGRGIPLMVQHLAGSDGRVWRHLLEDAEIQKKFRIIVYDLPYHGRSLPPPTVPWWTKEYRLTEDFFVETVLAISKALKLERPVFLGNGIGGSLAPALAFYHPEEFRAIIGVNSMVASSVPFARSMGRTPGGNQGPNIAYHPRVGNERHGTTAYELTSPDAPEWNRREIEWIFRQGAPGVFAGDLQYFANDHDLTGGKAEKIDTTRIDVHFISGEYQAADSAGPNSAKTLSEKIPGSTYAVSKSGSHPIVEDYSRFRQTLIPVLDRIHAKYARS
jgi:pimeloyl-ACP methyl ester carboxylesterase